MSTETKSPPPPSHSRFDALDLGFLLAVIGMVIVNFKMFLTPVDTSADINGFAELIQGRPEAFFLILSGIGLSWMAREQREFKGMVPLPGLWETLGKRGFILLGFGLVLTWVWQGHVFFILGMGVLVGLLLVRLHGLLLWAMVVGLVAGFVFLCSQLNYETFWDYETLTYTGFGSFKAIFSFLFFNGNYPVFPWLGFVLVGITLGRVDLTRATTRRWLWLVAILTWLVAGAASVILSFRVHVFYDLGFEGRELFYLFRDAAMPPMPIFFLRAVAISILLLVMVFWVAELLQKTMVLKFLLPAGRMSLTLYITHLLLGIGIMKILDAGGTQSQKMALVCAGIFSLVAIPAAWYWMKGHAHGPVEGYLRAGGTRSLWLTD